jgi:hypothetical protein
MTTNTLPSHPSDEITTPPETLQEACDPCAENTSAQLQVLADALRNFELAFSDCPDTVKHVRDIVGATADKVLGMNLHELLSVPVHVPGRWPYSDGVIFQK